MTVERSMRSGRLFGLFAVLVLFAMLQGCAFVRPTPNQPLNQWDPAAGYRFRNLTPPDTNNTDGLLIMAAFSGGGTGDLMKQGVSTYVLTDAGVSATATIGVLRAQPYSID